MRPTPARVLAGTYDGVNGRHSPMSKTATPAPTSAPPRNNFRKLDPSAKADMGLISQERPGWRRQWVEYVDQRHPQHVSKYLQEEQVVERDAKGEIFWMRRDGWRLVKQDDVQGRAPHDQGTPADGLVRKHSMVLIEIPEEDHAEFYGNRKRIRDGRTEANLRNGEEHAKGVRVGTKVRTGENYASKASLFQE